MTQCKLSTFLKNLHHENTAFESGLSLIRPLVVHDQYNDSNSMEKERVISSLLLLASVLTTCFLEARLIRTKQTFDEGRKLAITLPEPAALLANDGRLVHFTGRIMTDTASSDKHNQRDRVQADDHEARTHSARSNPFVLDATFGVAVKGVRLHRKVEMLQWVESSQVSTTSRDPEDGEPVAQERVYRYDLVWRSEHIDSNAFYQRGYWNPPREAWRFESETVQVRATTAIVIF